MQYHAIPCNTVKFNTIQCDTVQYNATSCNTMQYHAIPMQYHKIQFNTIRYNAIRCNTIGCHAIECNNMHYPAIPCNIIKYHMIQYNPKNTIFVPKLGNFGQSGPYNGPPSSQMGTYRKTEAIQSCLRIRGSYDAIESGPSEP